MKNASGLQHYVNNILNMSISERYDLFIQHCVDHETVWAIEMEGGYVTFTDECGDKIFPVYSDYDLTNELMGESYRKNGAKPIAMDLYKFIELCIPDMESLKVYFGIICNEKTQYQAVSAQVLLGDLKREIDFMENQIIE